MKKDNIANKNKINNFLHNFLTKAEKGSSDSLLFTLVAAFATALLMIVFLPAIQKIEAKTDMEHIKRQYILYMEIEGTLSTTNETSLINNLKSIPNVQDVVVNSNTILERQGEVASYGEEVYLDVSVIYKKHDYLIPSLFGVNIQESIGTYHLYAESTSKN